MSRFFVEDSKEQQVDENYDEVSHKEISKHPKFIEHINKYGTDFSLLIDNPEFTNFNQGFLFLCYKEFMRNKLKYTHKKTDKNCKIFEIIRIFNQDSIKGEVVYDGNRRIVGIEELDISHQRLPFLLKDLEFRLKQQLTYIKVLYKQMVELGSIDKEFLEEDMVFDLFDNKELNDLDNTPKKKKTVVINIKSNKEVDDTVNRLNDNEKIEKEEHKNMDDIVSNDSNSKVDMSKSGETGTENPVLGYDTGGVIQPNSNIIDLPFNLNAIQQSNVPLIKSDTVNQKAMDLTNSTNSPLENKIIIENTTEILMPTNSNTLNSNNIKEIKTTTSTIINESVSLKEEIISNDALKTLFGDQPSFYNKKTDSNRTLSDSQMPFPTSLQADILSKYSDYAGFSEDLLNVGTPKKVQFKDIVEEEIVQDGSYEKASKIIKSDASQMNLNSLRRRAQTRVTVQENSNETGHNNNEATEVGSHSENLENVIVENNISTNNVVVHEKLDNNTVERVANNNGEKNSKVTKTEQESPNSFKELISSYLNKSRF